MGERVHYARPLQKKPADQERMQFGLRHSSTSIHLSTAFLSLFFCIFILFFGAQVFVGLFFFPNLLFLIDVRIRTALL
jgi:hypothetical protein